MAAYRRGMSFRQGLVPGFFPWIRSLTYGCTAPGSSKGVVNLSLMGLIVSFCLTHCTLYWRFRGGQAEIFLCTFRKPQSSGSDCRYTFISTQAVHVSFHFSKRTGFARQRCVSDSAPLLVDYSQGPERSIRRKRWGSSAPRSTPQGFQSWIFGHQGTSELVKGDANVVSDSCWMWWATTVLHPFRDKGSDVLMCKQC